MKQDELRCPGQNTMFWKPDDIYDVVCPNCNKPVEFWKDDSKRTCICGHRFLNPKRDLGCLEYCKYAEQCMPDMFEGENLKALYRDRLLAVVKRTLKPEESTIQKAQDVSELAVEILTEEAGEPKVVIAAAVMGELLNSQRPEGQSGTTQAADSKAATTRKILAELGTEKEVTDQVCQIVEQRADSANSVNTNLRIVSDALNIVGLKERKALLDRAALERLIASKVQTETGQRLAQELLLEELDDE